ncbi:MAG: hypothetical protein O2968_20195 [Acidobacteria bacterium]|nr:hypothetical protein [Acidobacteriota bacterium]
MGGLDGDVEGVLELQRAGLDLLVEAFAFEEGHRDEGAGVGFSNLVNGADIRVVQSGGGLGFAFKALADIIVGNEMGGEKLQSDGAV